MKEYSLEMARAVAEAIMRSWAEVNVWPVNEEVPIGYSWKLHLWVEDGKRQAALYELDEFRWVIQKSKMYLPIPEVENETGK